MKTKSENDLLNYNNFTKIVENVIETTIECFIYGRYASLHSNWILIIDNDKCITLREIKIFVMNEIQTYHDENIKQLLKNQMTIDDGKIIEETIKKKIQGFVIMKKIIPIDEYEKELLSIDLGCPIENISSTTHTEPQKSNSIKYYYRRFCNCFTKKEIECNTNLISK
jgi:hypothetical protein